ncbi:P-loop containing nucleoside triphosphate hydrolase protein [Xylona heveae TC161]|uniref:RNA helicase n=1 Tax=Xylona heveae (strain CBS 132557 / TC161) TaxID=1328760 RepID=A0A165FZV0_XYLHT|nr:P-loop containing nucleoside triphosphate hydrolase protein [Xylona heveae TC161]KZF21576.1 P-loop containing nucleoside triphosphate hydrolase protein [Xylona heveae TC161]
MAQLKKRNPSRMTLSSRVAQPPPRISSSNRLPKRSSKGPFGGMNITEANIRGVPAVKSRAETKRSSGKQSTKDSKKGDKDKREGYHALKMQRALSSVPYGHRSSVKNTISEIESFEQFAFLPSIQQAITEKALPGLTDIQPTPIQRVAIPKLLGQDGKRKKRSSAVNGKPEMEQFLLAGETGSGKTLAYLLPTIDAIKRQEAADAEIAAEEEAAKEERKKANPYEVEAPPLSNEPHPTTGRPRAIILVPTAELVSQVGSLTKSLSHVAKFRSALISSAYSGRIVRNRLFSPAGIDVLVSTPHLLASITESDPNVLSRVTHIVVDEADSMLDRSFSPLTSAIIDRASPSLRQLILCSATIPRSLDTFVRQRFPDATRLVTPNLHAIPRRVQLGVVDIEKDPYRGNRNLACADTIWTIGRTAAEVDERSKGQTETKHIIVFVNEREKAQEVADFLSSKGIDAIAVSRDTPEQRQSEILSAFTSSSASDATSSAPSAPAVSRGSARRTLPNTKVLVMTDLGSRGIDTLAVRHVVLYDVPHTSIDFIHRLGRTGRMGRRGRGIVLVGRGDRKDVVKEVREGMYKGQALI